MYYADEKMVYGPGPSTTVGLGTWAMGGPWQYGWGPMMTARKLSWRSDCARLGINWIDTAPAYGLGHSEELVGQALRQTKYKPYLATKCGILWNERKEKVVHLKRDSVRRECEASLRRLGIERIDLYQMHWPDPLEDIEDAWRKWPCWRRGQGTAWASPQRGADRARPRSIRSLTQPPCTACCAGR
jgi:aryl-alcohol dehydrogenase-like predicted oxidoreductase